jgi:hypothetical protein
LLPGGFRIDRQHRRRIRDDQTRTFLQTADTADEGLRIALVER